jgi:hypothetical protein
MAAFDPEDVFHFSNPADVAEFNRLYRRAKVRVTVDNRDPWPHPWAKFLPKGWEIQRSSLKTGINDHPRSCYTVLTLSGYSTSIGDSGGRGHRLRGLTLLLDSLTGFAPRFRQRGPTVVGAVAPSTSTPCEASSAD